MTCKDVVTNTRGFVHRDGLIVFVILAIFAAIIAPYGLRRLAEQPDPIGYAALIVSGILLLLGFVSVVKEAHALEGWSGVAAVLITCSIVGIAIVRIGKVFDWVKGLLAS